MRVHAHQGDTLDALLWRHAGRTAALVEATLNANQGLADLGVVLPHGLVAPGRSPPAMLAASWAALLPNESEITPTGTPAPSTP